MPRASRGNLGSNIEPTAETTAGSTTVRRIAKPQEQEVIPPDTPFNLKNFFGQRRSFTYRYLVSQGWLQPGLPLSQGDYWKNVAQQNYFDFLEFGDTTGGGGGGAAGPTFAKPDEGAVREQVRAYVIATTGTGNDALVEQAVAAYMSSARNAFDKRKTEQIDPWGKVQSIVRASAAYKSVQDSRPDSVDEMTWVVERQEKLRGLGLSATRAEQVGIDQATVGGSDEALIGAGQIAQQQGTGRLLKSHRDSLKRRANAVLGLI